MNTQFRLTKEEIAIMDECRKSSFWYRSVPLMAAASGLMTYRRLNNLVSPKMYGLKLTGVIFGAYILGKVSYIPECRKMIAERLPDSNLARSFNSKSYDLISDMAQPPEIVSKSTTTSLFGSHGEQQDDQLDFIMPPQETSDKNATRRYVTYDELRQKNRAEHAAKYSGPKSQKDTSTPNAARTSPTQDNYQYSPTSSTTYDNQGMSPTVTNPPKRPAVRRNQYGDEIYD